MHWIDPEHLPETTGLVDRFLVNADGEADGVVLMDGTEIHFPPHLGSEILAAVRPGGTIHVRGVRPRGATVLAAVSVAAEDGARIVDAGPPADDAARKVARKQARARRVAMEAQGVVRQVLHGPKGEVRGVMLEDGRTGRLPPGAAADLATLLVANSAVLFRGEGLVTPHGTVIAIREIGTSAADLRSIGGVRPQDRHPKRTHGKHEPHHGSQGVADAP